MKDNNVIRTPSVESYTFPQIVDEMVLSYDGEINIDYKLMSKYYFKLLGSSFFMAVLSGLFTYLMSLINWSNNINDYKNYFNVQVTTIVMCVSFICFGTIYITYYTYLMNDISIFRDKYFLASIVIHTVGYPCICGILISQNINIWYYYLDFIYFFVSFLPFSIHAAYVTKRNNAMEKLESDMRNDMKYAIKYGIAETIIVVSALSYTFFLVPIFTRQSVEVQFVWRLLFHPFFFELTMLVPQRILSEYEDFTNEGQRFFPVLHALYHYVTIGVTLTLMISDIRYSIALIILTSIIEGALRCSISFRDRIVANKIFKIDNSFSINTYGAIINLEMMLRLVAVLSSPVMMIVFTHYDYLFIFNVSQKYMYVNCIALFICEVISQIVTSYYDISKRATDLSSSWDQLFNWRLTIFFTYGYWTMGILGMLYIMMVLPRAMFCDDPNDFLTCSYLPSQ